MFDVFLNMNGGNKHYLSSRITDICYCSLVPSSSEELATCQLKASKNHIIAEQQTFYTEIGNNTGERNAFYYAFAHYTINSTGLQMPRYKQKLQKEGRITTGPKSTVFATL